MYGPITIEVISCTRKRLIQTGTTNTHTYDFETSQGLYFCTSKRAAIPLPLASEKDTGPYKVDSLPIEYVWGADWDHWDREIIPQGYKKTYKIHFPRLQHNKFWRSANWSDKVNWFYMVPGAQGYYQTAHIKMVTG